MYLTTIDPKTGLVNIADIDDGVLSIKAFRDVINDPTLGIECFTAIALVADYRSPKSYYDENDRPRAAMEEVTGNRDKWTWHQEKIQVALNKYDQLQYDPTIEEGKIHYERKVMKLKELKESQEYYSKPRNKEEEESKGKIIKATSTISAELRDINKDIAEYEKTIQGKEVFEKAPTKQGYTLSRLEQLIEKKNSFYKQKR